MHSTYLAYLAFMSRSQWVTIFSAVLLVLACFLPWAKIPGPDLTISGVDTTGTRFGKPAYFHFILTALILLFGFINKLWAKRINIFLGALNLAWALKNFVVLTKCEAGECPVKGVGLWLALVASAALLLTTFFPNIKIGDIKPDN